MPIYMALAGAGVAGHLDTRSLMMLKDKYGFKDYEDKPNYFVIYTIIAMVSFPFCFGIFF